MKFNLLVCLLITSQLLIISCNQNKSSQNTQVDNIDTVITTADKLTSDSVSILLNVVRKFSESYDPKTNSKTEIPFLKNIPENIAYSIKRLRINGNEEYIKHLTLILVKLYKEHLKCCHQGYELRNKVSIVGIDSIADPLLFEFNLVSKIFDNKKPIEFINSAIAFSWVEQNKQLLDYKKLKSEYDKIKKIISDIEKNPGLYNH